MENLSVNPCADPSPQTSQEFGVPEQDERRSESVSADALAELYDLLKDYAPSWYTDRHRRRAEDVLRMLGRL